MRDDDTLQHGDRDRAILLREHFTKSTCMRIIVAATSVIQISQHTDETFH